MEKNMDTRTRFHTTLSGGHPDRVPYFEEGIRSDVIAAWKKQGLSSEQELHQRFTTDQRDELRIDIDPHPTYATWPTSMADLDRLPYHFNLENPNRLPENLESLPRQQPNCVRMLRVHEGLFLTFGVDAARRFNEVIFLLADRPDFVRAYLQFLGEFSATLAERLLKQVEVDALIFSEPIGDNHDALISPRMYEELILPGYQPLLDVARRYGVQTLICRTYANVKSLIPTLLEAGIDCLWACEVESSVMNYPALRREYGRDLKLIGGIDVDALRAGKDAIQRAVDEIAPLIPAGSYIPLADGRVRADVSYENYLYYRQLLEEIAS